MKAFQHSPVLLEESIRELRLEPGLQVLDGTLGGGGHASRFLSEILPDGWLYACDLDREALEAGGGRLGEIASDHWTLYHGSVSEWLLSDTPPPPLDRVFLDLGVSSHQIDTATRGFSFQSDGPLDMRMNQSEGALTAAEVVNTYSEKALADLLWTYGEERRSRRMARAIVDRRAASPFETTLDLAMTLERVAPRRGERLHPATRAFQALRIEVNDEIGRLERALESIWPALVVGGRLAVITFHGLEVRVVRRFAKERARSYTVVGERDIPEWRQPKEPDLRPAVRKSILPSEREALLNPRARSAQLRVFEKIHDSG